MVAVSFALILQERKFQGGSGQISECMAKELGDLVKMNSPVYRIDQTGDMVVVETLDKQTYKVSARDPCWGSLSFPRRCHVTGGGEKTGPLNSCEPLQADVRRSRQCTLEQKSCVFFFLSLNKQQMSVTAVHT